MCIQDPGRAVTPVRVVVADDQPVVRAALVDLLSTDPGIDVVGTASNAQQAIARCVTLAPDLVLMDVKMPGGGGAKATRVIRQSHPDTRVVAFSAHQDRSTVLEMLSAGAAGYVTKGSPPAEIIAAIHKATQGLALLSSAVSGELVQELGTRLRAEEEQVAARRRRVERIEAAIGGDLRMVFQPIVDLCSGHLAGVEGLARFDGEPAWTPDVWFAEAAALGLGVPLERAALRAALTALDELPPDAFLSVNLSPHALLDPGFWDDVAPIVLSRLVVELTDHAAVQDYEGLRAALRPLRFQGAKLAVDAAGAGFASLRHIVLLDADLIKIDTSIIADLHHHHAHRALASALVTFAAEGGAAVVAEGIEQMEELNALKELGASLGQGSLLGPPDPIGELDLGRERLRPFPFPEREEPLDPRTEAAVASPPVQPPGGSSSDVGERP